jgi:CheY-like chemotaxis protein
MAKILVIDDDPDVVLAARMCLEDAGHTVSSASNGEEGLRQIKTDRPDLIILDVMMDTATEGFQLALKLRSPQAGSDLAPFRNIPILMLTAIHSTTPLRFGPDQDYLPVEEFIDKPFEPKALVRKVETLLKKAK